MEEEEKQKKDILHTGLILRKAGRRNPGVLTGGVGLRGFTSASTAERSKTKRPEDSRSMAG